MTYNIENQIIVGLPSIALITKSYIVAHESGNPKNISAKALDNELTFMKRNCNNAYEGTTVKSYATQSGH